MTSTKTQQIALPAGITEKDTTYPKGEPYTSDYDNASFEMFYTERFGWVIPCLLISRASGRQHRMGATTDRSYAIAVRDRAMVRVGLGPHVKRAVTVHVRKSREAALKPFIDLRTEGSSNANDTRDRISTRRMQTSMRRSGWGF